jgi:HSP20 family protein
MADSKELQRAKKDEVAETTEHTRAGPVYKPTVDIFENASGITLLADMPGVKAEDLEIDLREGVLTLTGRIVPLEGEGETDVLREYNPGTFYRQFSVSDTIDQAKIDAKLTNGVLTLQLPKAEAAKPRQIPVKAG